MTKNKKCTHCKAAITCQSEQIDRCECSQVQLHPDTRVFLRSSFHKCLCNACLEQMNLLVAQAKTEVFPRKRNEMVEGKHYYVENGYFVFTELYHFLKGQCCQNGCRHCVYGFKNRYL
ncbi:MULTISPECIES: cysteine-rich CWC family protein [unclassified Myroides]|uniref:cysteine-rich CWC family protein n=1 Tax=unclassified Myroides TaxID=2642485 RepID=UPI0015F9F5B8|nr:MULTISPECIES: cysteine-rich CWC family protein [unclassified Myroides]MBB1148632.1 cysteine-rich CWC family protein [Myroides sp. NP-2]MDM1406343.1 cysteine-rich CWC family protein [Myroides sp. DF42-4-2]